MSMAEAKLRNEYKYRISLASASLLRFRLRALLKADAHARADGGYQVRSLYFDDCDFSAYFDKLSGVKERTKYRVRFYNRDDGYIVFEKKSKRGERMQKESVRISRDQAERMCAREALCLDENAPSLLREYALLASAGGLRPAALVDYDRFAYTMPLGNVRVTLDLGLRTAPLAGGLFENRPAFPVMEENEGILEVKFDALLPTQVALLVQDIPKERLAISKYCRCLALLTGQ